MKLRVMGCSGGVAAGLETTSFLVDDDILIDAGTGVSNLDISALQALRHIFITHSHLDHIAGLPLIVDTLFGQQQAPLKVYAHPDTIDALRKHIFNWLIWPDFEAIKGHIGVVFEFVPMQHGEVIEISERRLEMIPVNHVVPGVGYRVSHGDRAFAFSGDTTVNDTLWSVLNSRDSLDMLIVECGFPNRDQSLAEIAKHYCPALLALDLLKLDHRPDLAISHLKPGDESLIMSEIHRALPEYKILRLQGDDTFIF